MALKMKLTKAEHDVLAEPVRQEYVEKDGAYVLNIDGGAVATADLVALQSKLADFRSNNITLTNENKELKAKTVTLDKYEGVDPEKYKQMETEISELKKKGVGTADDVVTIVAREVERATKTIKDQLKTEQEARIAAQQAADQGKFRELVSADATKAGVAGSALRHVLREADSLFEWKDGSLVAKEGVKHPTEPLQDYTPTAWLQNLAKSDPYLFEPSNGGGAPGASGASKPGSKILRNPSPEEMGAHMEDIASGKITVVRS